ncbi:hypothetical protein GH714_025232 [Hevea brasiliensis]|uniref:NTP pyrophosphohydrolase MazG-like domain-containing protein n=1 Tax=Hevea brasiliensis TaxID=3981 RepID=A0A6A6KU74_HEVBR|nr:hypothetical protein GH714_025232 [Hevea brasiliensis]
MTGVSDGESVSLDLLKKKMAEFAQERDWDRFHSPRNLLLALVGEVGELSEIFQWKGEVPKGLPDWKEEEKVHLGEELSDVLLYLVRLSDICGIDLGKAALRKVELNAIKYPVSMCKGSSKKYNSNSNNSTQLRIDQLTVFLACCPETQLQLQDFLGHFVEFVPCLSGKWTSVLVGGISILPNLNELAAIQALQSNLVHSVGPLFFAALKDRPSGYLNTPLTVVAAGLAKWLDIYSGVLMVRVLLSWFPNIPWDRQPLSAIRDLCDPYLNLFRNIIPPIFDTLDVSPLLAFAVLGMLGSILHSSGGVY